MSIATVPAFAAGGHLTPHLPAPGFTFFLMRIPIHDYESTISNFDPRSDRFTDAACGMMVRFTELEKKIA